VLGLLKGGVERGRLGSLVAIAGAVALLLLTHALTASWIVGISGLYVSRVRRHGFWLLGMAVTLGTLMLWRQLGIDYGNRYAFFAAFFAQFLLAEVMALGLLGLWRPLCELSAARRWPRLDRPLTLAIALGALTAWQSSPMWTEHGKAVRPPWTLLREPSAHDVYYARFGALEPLLTRDDVVLARSDMMVFDLAAITGAHFVSAPYMVRVPDQTQREADVQTFFDPETSADQRQEIARRRGATKVLLASEQFALLEPLQLAMGRPLYQDDRLALFATQPDPR
jgi:hypothetical protein